MDLKNITIFIYVTELSGFTKAAKRLGFSQSTISFRIRQPETEPDVQMTEKDMSYRRLTDKKLAALSMEIRPVPEMGSTELICRLAAQGTGCSFLPDFVTEDAVREGRIARLHANDFRIKVWKQLICHRDKWISPQMEAVMAYCAQI